MLDLIVDRRELKSVLARGLRFMGCTGQDSEAKTP
jgi:hypothetical protein